MGSSAVEGGRRRATVQWRMVDADTPDSGAILAAAQRLTGHLVRTPMIGDLRLPGFGFHGVRIKAECLQMAGTLMFRGYLHCLQRSLGRWKGLALAGSPREIYAQAVAASLHRLPACAVVEGDVQAGLLDRIEDTGCEVQRVGAGEAARVLGRVVRSHGFQPMPALGDRDVWCGIATIGVELAQELPREIAAVQISPACLAEPVRGGLRAADREVDVRGVDRSEDASHAELARAVLTGLRVDSDPDGLAALASVHSELLERSESPTCVVLSC